MAEQRHHFYLASFFPPSLFQMLLSDTTVPCDGWTRKSRKDYLKRVRQPSSISSTLPICRISVILLRLIASSSILMAKLVERATSSTTATSRHRNNTRHRAAHRYLHQRVGASVTATHTGAADIKQLPDLLRGEEKVLRGVPHIA
jgi:hypothetical protein